MLELVGLVEDHRVVGRERARDGVASLLGGDLHGEIGEEERVVDDHDPRLLHVAAHLGDEALGVVLAARADAGLARRAHLAPERVALGQRGELGHVAGLGVAGPGLEQRERAADRGIPVAAALPRSSL